MARRTEAPAAPEKKKRSVPRIVGEEAKTLRLDVYRPNDWNPNGMTAEEFDLLVRNLDEKGWARSDALLVWGTDEKGRKQNVIINGEHRWRAATKLGWATGPVVVLNGITRAEAVQWTIRLDKNRGRFDPEKLHLALDRELGFGAASDVQATALALSLGFTEEQARDLRVSIPNIAAPAGSPPPLASLQEDVGLDDVRPHPRNYKKHPREQLEHLVESLRTYGMWRGIVVARDGTILAGHGVHEAARMAGLKRVRIVRFPLDPMSAAALKIVAIDNEVGRFGESDDRQMTEILREIKEQDPRGLLGTGLDEAMLAALVMVTRPASEIRGVDAAAEWAGMPGYDPTSNTNALCRVIVNFDTEADRAAFIAQNGLIIHKRLNDATGVAGKLFTTYWPPRPRDDIASLRFKEAEEKPKRKKKAAPKSTPKRRKAA